MSAPLEVLLEVRRDNYQPPERTIDRPPRNGSFSGASDEAQTASEFISSQLQLEADAREALPYTFDHCTNPLGPLKQNIFSCLTCNQPPQSPTDTYKPAGICYSCSIQCHGEHTLVELFGRRNFTCDCGTTRLPTTSPCTLRIDPDTGVKGPVHSQVPAEGNTYNRNFYNRFCGCGEIYDAHEQKGTMFQCYGLATEEDGGCGEDWWHPECVLGLERGKVESAGSEKTSDVTLVNSSPVPVDEETAESGPPLPLGFPAEEDFETFICYKCMDVNPWLKAYAGTKGFLAPVFKATHKAHLTTPLSQEYVLEGGHGGHHEKLCQAQAPLSADEISADRASSNRPGDRAEEFVSGLTASLISDPSCSATSMKRKAEPETPELADSSDSKRQKVDEGPRARHLSLPPAPRGIFSLFLRDDFRDYLCRCAECYPILRAHPQLLEEEVLYEPPLSQDGEGDGDGESMGTGSLLDRGEAALSNVDRVRAIEGVMVYNHLKDKVKSFLQPFAESGQPVAAEDIKAYFVKLRGDDMAIKAAGGRVVTAGGNDATEGGDRSEQSGY